VVLCFFVGCNRKNTLSVLLNIFNYSIISSCILYALSLSLYIYIYVYVCVCVCVYITMPNSDYDVSKTTRKCRIFQLFSYNDARCTCQIKSRTVMAKACNKDENLFTSRLDLNVGKMLAKC